MSKSATAYVFIDTNTALHYQRPEQIDWLKLTGAGEVVLVATPILLRELEEKKVFIKSQKLRERAGTYIKWLHQFMVSPMTEVRSNVTWLFLPDEPQIDFSAERLSESISDDQLIASVLYFSRQSGARHIVATADIGLEVKLINRRIDVLTLPDDLSLPVELDPTERENEELRKKIARIESRMPKLSITFENGAQYHTLHDCESKFTNVKSMEQMKEELPFMTTAGETALSSPVMTKNKIEQINYNQRVENYFSDYDNYIDRYALWQETICMHHTIKLVIANDGTAPASSVDVELFFPDGVVPVDKDGIPEEPNPPAVPRQKKGISVSHFADKGNHDVLVRTKECLKRLALLLPNIEQDKNSICISYVQLKHGFSETCKPVIIRFMSRDAMGSFKIRYRLSANELPDAIENDLHIRIDETQQ